MLSCDPCNFPTILLIIVAIRCKMHLGLALHAMSFPVSSSSLSLFLSKILNSYKLVYFQHSLLSQTYSNLFYLCFGDVLGVLIVHVSLCLAPPPNFFLLVIPSLICDLGYGLYVFVVFCSYFIKRHFSKHPG